MTNLTYSVGMRFWYVHAGKLGIVFLDSTGKLKSIDQTGQTLRIYGYSYPSEVLTDGSDIDDEIDVHELAENALVDKLTSLLYKRGDLKDPQLASFYHRSYVGELRNAKKTLNKRRNEDIIRGI